MIAKIPGDSYFDRAAGTYLKRSRRGVWRYLREREVSAILRLLKPARGENLLELGCGAGYYARTLSQDYGLSVTGVDRSQQMLQQMLQQTRQQVSATPITAVLGDLEWVEISEKFDKILAAGVFEFVPSLDGIFARCALWLRPQGRLVLLVPRSGINGWIYKQFHEWQGCPTFIRSLETYASQAREAGLDLEQVLAATPISVALSFRFPPAG